MGAGRLARTSPREAIGIGLREGGEPREPAATEDGMTRDRAAKFLPFACIISVCISRRAHSAHLPHSISSSISATLILELIQELTKGPGPY